MRFKNSQECLILDIEKGQLISLQIDRSFSLQIKFFMWINKKFYFFNKFWYNNKKEVLSDKGKRFNN